MSKNCQKGYSCKASCISRNKDCLKDYSPEVSRAVNTVADLVVEKMLLEAALDSSNTEEEVEKLNEELGRAIMDNLASGGIDKRQIKALDDIKKAIDNGELTEIEIEEITQTIMSVYLLPKTDVRAKADIAYEDLPGLIKQLETFDEAFTESTKNGYLDPDAPGGIGEWINKNAVQVEISDRAAELAYNALPTEVSSKLNKRGSVSSQERFEGYDENGNAIFGGGCAKCKGIQVVKSYMEQQGVDPYLFPNKKRWNLNEMEWEHGFPYTRGGEEMPGKDGRNIADGGNNTFLSTKGTNRGKGEKNPKDWLEDRIVIDPKTGEEKKVLGLYSKAKMTKEEYEKQQAKGKKESNEDRVKAREAWEKAITQESKTRDETIRQTAKVLGAGSSKYLFRAVTDSTVDENNPKKTKLVETYEARSGAGKGGRRNRNIVSTNIKVNRGSGDVIAEATVIAAKLPMDPNISKNRINFIREMNALGKKRDMGIDSPWNSKEIHILPNGKPATDKNTGKELTKYQVKQRELDKIYQTEINALFDEYDPQ